MKKEISYNGKSYEGEIINMDYQSYYAHLIRMSSRMSRTYKIKKILNKIILNKIKERNNI